MEENKTATGGIGFFGLLTLVFIVLKLTGFITWSWWWVLAPLWGSILFGIVLIVIVLLLRHGKTHKEQK